MWLILCLQAHLENPSELKLNNMSSLIGMTEIGNNPFQEEYATWRRQRKYYESEIKRLKGEVSQTTRSNYKGIWPGEGML